MASKPRPSEPFDDRLTFVGCVLGVAPAGQHDHVCHDVESWNNQEGVVSEAMPSVVHLGICALRRAMATTVCPREPASASLERAIHPAWRLRITRSCDDETLGSADPCLVARLDAAEALNGSAWPWCSST